MFSVITCCNTCSMKLRSMFYISFKPFHVTRDVACHVYTSKVSIALTLDHIGNQSTGGVSLLTQELLDELQSIGNIEIIIESNLSLITIIGNRLHQHKGVSGKMFASLQRYNVCLFSHGASGHNICLLVATEDAENVMSKIYMQLFS